MDILLLIIICLFSYQAEAGSLNEVHERIFKEAVPAGSIHGSDLEEASGIIASRSNPGMFWVINDSGNKPTLYLINDKAELMHSFWIQDLENRDWEDITFFQDKANGERKLVIADIGDNAAIRDYISIILLEEPVYSVDSDSILDDFRIYNFRYVEGARDAETIFCDPISNRIYIVTKREDNVGVYEIPEYRSESDTLELKKVSSLPFRNITSGDISTDGDEILLKTYDSIFYWQRDINKLISHELKKEPISVDYKVEPQGESICWSIDGSGFYTLSEKSWSDEQILYYYEKTGDD